MEHILIRFNFSKQHVYLEHIFGSLAYNLSLIKKINGFKWLVFASQLGFGEAHFTLFFYQGHSFPIKSGDNIALRSAFTRGQWLKCTRASCVWTNCRSSNIADPTGSASCPERMIFTIKAKDGGVINSGDTVSL